MLAPAAEGLEITQCKQLCIIQGCGSDTNHISSPFPHQTHIGPQTPFAVVLGLSTPLARPQPQGWQHATLSTVHCRLQVASASHTQAQTCCTPPPSPLQQPPPPPPPVLNPTLYAHTACSHGGGWLCSSQACCPCTLCQSAQGMGMCMSGN